MTRTEPIAPAPAIPVLWSLNGLRAVGAVLVMLYHVNSWNLQVLRGSSAFYTGVGLFFVLSGFVLTWTARPGTTIGAFATRRLARIFPNHLVALAVGVAVTALVLRTPTDPDAVLLGTFLLQAWSPDASTVFAVNGVAWSLSCEVAFYAAFPALLWGLRRLRARTRTTVAVGALLVPPVLGVVWPALIPLLFHLPPSRLPEFVLGMVTAMAVQDGWRPRVPAPVLLGVLAAAILGAAAVDVHPTALTAVLALIFAPLAARCARGDVDGRNRWARHPAVMLGGALSFSFYLLHELVIKVVVATPLRGWVTVPLVLVVSALLALGMWRGVELPARARILAAARQPGPRLLGAARTAGSRRPRHSRPLSVVWSFPVPTPATGVGAVAAGSSPAAPAAPAVPAQDLAVGAAVAGYEPAPEAVSAYVATFQASATEVADAWAPPEQVGTSTSVTAAGSPRTDGWTPPRPPAALPRR
ncbi:acyltransferase family protein [Cellulomonas sp. Marseille-Q8402]